MSSHPSGPEQADRSSPSNPSHIDLQPQQQQPPNNQQQFHQQTALELPPPLRPLQPQPHTFPPFNSSIYNPYIYSRPPLPHSQMPQAAQPAQSSAGYSESDHDIKRLRISRACDGCRRKKIKCDTKGQGSTCKSCRLANTVCTFKDSAKKRGPPKGYIEVLENRLKRMEKLLGGMADDKEIESASEANGQEAEILVSPKQEPTKSPPQSASSSSSSSSSISAPWPSTNDLPPSSATSTSAMGKPSSPSGTNSESCIHASTKKSPATVTNSGKRERPQSNQSIAEIHPRYIGDMSTLPFLAQKFNFEDDRFTSPAGIKIRRFGQSLVMYEEGDSTTGRTPNQRILETIGMLKPGEPIRDVDDWIFKVADITKPTSDRLMKIYFAYIHPGLPVVNKTLFLNQYRGLADDYPSAPLLNAMYGAATRYIETCKLFGDETAVTEAFDDDIDGWQIPEGGSERLFDNLIKYVRGRYNPNIATIQALVIAQNHRASMDGKMTGGWLINAAAIRMAQDLGLHRSSDVWDISEGEKETRRRVWWAVYIMDKWSAASTGRPQTIFDEDCDESYPSESAPWEEVMDVATDIKDTKSDDHLPRFPSLEKSVAQKAKGERIPIYQPFVQLVKLSEILGHILQGLYTPWAKKYSAEHGSDAIVSYLDKALSDWRAALPPTLQVSGTNFRKLDSRGRTPLLSMSGLMYLSYCTLLILLHRPFIEKEGGEKTKSSVSSLSICTSAATRCVDVAASMHFRDFLLVSWNFAIYHVFTASLIHIHTAAHSGSIVSDVAKGDLIKSVRVVKRLSNLSTAACQIHQVLLRLMKMGNIPYTDDDDDDDNDDSSKQLISKESEKGNKATSVLSTSTPASSHRNISTNAKVDTDGSGMDSIKSGVSSRVSDVGRGQLPRKSTNSPINNDSQFTPSSAPQHDDRTNSASSTPSSMINGDWINGLYSSLQQDGNQASFAGTNPHLESDPHSLRQFGMNMEQMFTPIDQMNVTTNPPNAMALNQSQQFNLAAVGLTQNFLFGLSNIGFAAGETQQSEQQEQQQPLQSLYQSTPRSDLFTASTSSSIAQNHTQQQEQQAASSQNNNTNGYAFPIPMPSSLPSATVPSQLPLVDHSLFRNRPDNPFWSVPSSIEMDDWTAYLLPPQGGDNGIIGQQQHQQQQQQQQHHQHHQTQQQQQHEPQQQQTWPSGWA